MSNLSKLWICFFWSVILCSLHAAFFGYLVLTSHPQLKFFCFGWIASGLLYGNLTAMSHLLEQSIRDQK